MTFRLALCVMFHNDLSYLKLHLPVFRGAFDGIVGITDPTCNDGSLDYMESLGANVLMEPWSFHWGDFAQRMLNEAEREGYDGAIRVDPDEAIFPDLAVFCRETLGRHAALINLPRYEVYGNRLLYRPEVRPDMQSRGFLLGHGIAYVGAEHEVINPTACGISEGGGVPPEHRLLNVDPDLHRLNIFHYGYASATGRAHHHLHYTNMDRRRAGQPPLPCLPPDCVLPLPPVEPFLIEQPLDPNTVGLTAPYEY